MFKKFLMAASLATAATSVSAATSFNLTISGNPNVPVFTLTNTSSAAQLETFSVSIGLLSRNFDYILALTDPGGGSSTVTAGDGVNNGTRVDVLGLSYTDFDPGETASFEADVDSDTGNQNVTLDYRNTLFNNGTGPNSELTATFSDATTLSFTIPDQTAGLNSYSFDVSAAPIPLPAGLPLLVAGLGAFAVMRKRAA